MLICYKYEPDAVLQMCIIILNMALALLVFKWRSIILQLITPNKNKIC